MLQKQKLLLLIFLLAAAANGFAALRVVSFVKANIGDSARVVKERALDFILKDAVEQTHCLKYVDMRLRDSIATTHFKAKEPFSFKTMATECGVNYGVFFSLERYGYLVRLASKVIDINGTVLERSELTLLQASDTIDSKNPFEPALRRMITRIASALAIAADSTCPVRVPKILPLIAGGVVLHHIDKGFGMFLSDNSERVCNLVLARISDSLRMDQRFLVVDVYSRDKLFSHLGEFDIQNTSPPTMPEIALLHAAGVPIYLIAEIDSAENYTKLHLSVHVFSTDPKIITAVHTYDRIIGSDLEQMYSTINELAVEAAEQYFNEW